jgi:hypothetical protein
MRFFEKFISERTFTPEQIEARRLAEYWTKGKIAEMDKLAYVEWLENKLEMAQVDATR